jgi:hypothetical protein
MRFSKLSISRIGHKALIFSSFAAICFAQIDPTAAVSAVDRGGPGSHEMASTGTPQISFAQGNYATPQSAQSTVQVKFTSAQASGDL